MELYRMDKVLFEDSYRLMKVALDKEKYYFSVGNLEVRGPFDSEVECYRSVCEDLTCVLAQVICVFSHAKDRINDAQEIIEERLRELCESQVRVKK